MNVDKKTTIAATAVAVTTAVKSVLQAFGVSVPTEVFDGILAIGFFIWGLYTNKKD